MPSITLCIAAWGAVLSTVTLIWQLMQWRERTIGRVRVFVFREQDIFCCYPDGTKEPGIEFRAVNDGPKPVTLEAFWVQVKGWHRRFESEVPTSLPKQLNEGDPVKFVEDRGCILAWLESAPVNPPWKCKAIFRSNAGREYRRGFTVEP